MDVDNNGEIGYDEFTLLSEERWRIIDPYKRYKDGIENFQINSSMAASSSIAMGDSDASKLGIKSNDTEGYEKLESLSKNHLKIPIRKPEKQSGFVNINRKQPNEYEP